MKTLTLPRITRARSALVATLAVLVSSLAFTASAFAVLPVKAVTECFNDGGGCRVVDVGGGCHVYEQFDPNPGLIFAHNTACGYGTVHNGSYWDYEGSF